MTVPDQVCQAIRYGAIRRIWPGWPLILIRHSQWFQFAERCPEMEPGHRIIISGRIKKIKEENNEEFTLCFNRRHIRYGVNGGSNIDGSANSGMTATIGYNYDGTGARPRAFALVLQTTGGTITSVTPAKTGESTAAAKGLEFFRARSILPLTAQLALTAHR